MALKVELHRYKDTVNGCFVWLQDTEFVLVIKWTYLRMYCVIRPGPLQRDQPVPGVGKHPLYRQRGPLPMWRLLILLQLEWGSHSTLGDSSQQYFSPKQKEGKWDFGAAAGVLVQLLSISGMVSGLWRMVVSISIMFISHFYWILI